jgi:hypothetical protein
MPFSPRHTACTIGGVGRLIITTSALFATSCADAATVAPRAFSGASASALVSKIVSECPASSRRAAIGPPMRPTPTNPIICPAIDSSSHPFRLKAEPTTAYLMTKGLGTSVAVEIHTLFVCMYSLIMS